MLRGALACVSAVAAYYADTMPILDSVASCGYWQAHARLRGLTFQRLNQVEQLETSRNDEASWSVTCQPFTDAAGDRADGTRPGRRLLLTGGEARARGGRRQGAGR